MLPIVTNGVVWSVSLSVTLESPVKTAKPIEMLFGLKTRVGPGNHVLDGGPDPSTEGAILRGRGIPLQSIGTLQSSAQKQPNRSRCRLGCGLGWAQGIIGSRSP